MRLALPESCSARVAGEKCQLPPSYVVSAISDEGEFMLAVVCNDHKALVENRLISMQKRGQVPPGKIRFDAVRNVTTDCIKGMSEDYIDIELQRGIDSDRSIVP